jgi:hypothetical protein
MSRAKLCIASWEAGCTLVRGAVVREGGKVPAKRGAVAGTPLIASTPGLVLLCHATTCSEADSGVLRSCRWSVIWQGMLQGCGRCLLLLSMFSSLSCPQHSRSSVLP